MRERERERERDGERKKKEESTYWYNIHCLTKPRSFKCLKISFYAGQNLPSMYPPKITSTTYYINILDVFNNHTGVGDNTSNLYFPSITWHFA